tara:strand:- start:9555 stop:10208 length:654 start_codon:yes stop_codon:yes gene_type:complete
MMMKQRLQVLAMFLTLLTACTFFVFALTGCQPKLSTHEPGPRQVDDTARMITGDTAEDEHSWATWETCSQKVGDHPCNFELMNQHEEMIELYDYYDKVIVLDFSTIWCSVCRYIAPKGDEFVADYGADDFMWITILIDAVAYGVPPTLDDIQDWVDQYEIEGQVLMGDRSLVDLNGDYGYPITSWPTLVVIDQNMTLQHGLNGWNEATIRGWVEDLL